MDNEKLQINLAPGRIIEESRDKIINTELDKIRKLCPEIPIMEV